MSHQMNLALPRLLTQHPSATVAEYEVRARLNTFNSISLEDARGQEPIKINYMKEKRYGSSST